MTATIIHYFVEIDDTLNATVVGTSQSANGPKALVQFADKRYGKGLWGWKISNSRKYVIAKDGRCLEASPFPVNDCK